MPFDQCSHANGEQQEGHTHTEKKIPGVGVARREKKEGKAVGGAVKKAKARRVCKKTNKQNYCMHVGNENCEKFAILINDSSKKRILFGTS